MKSWGFAPNPTYFFVLTQKSMQKKSRLRPPRTKKLRLAAKKSELALAPLSASNSRFFLRRLRLFFGSRPMPLFKTLLMLGESARRRTSSVRIRTSSVVSKQYFYPLSFNLYPVFSPAGKRYSPRYPERPESLNVAGIRKKA